MNVDGTLSYCRTSYSRNDDAFYGRSKRGKLKIFTTNAAISTKMSSELSSIRGVVRTVDVKGVC